MSQDDPLLAAGSQPKSNAGTDLGPPATKVEIQGVREILQGVGKVLPAMKKTRDVLKFFVENPDTFLTIADALQHVLNDETCVGKWDLGVHPLGHAVAAYIDKTMDAELTINMLSDSVTDEELADLVCQKALAIPRVRALGVQGSTGLQINRGEVLKYAGMFLQNVLPLLLPLLMKK